MHKFFASLKMTACIFELRSTSQTNGSGQCVSCRKKTGEGHGSVSRFTTVDN